MARVLIAVAGAEVDGDAIHEILGLLRPDHELIFVTVNHAAVQALVTDAGLGAPVILADEAWEELDSTARQSADHELREKLDGLGLQGRIRVETGDPGERICAVAIEEKVDLIVMGSHHAGVLRRILGASVADDVTHHAPCPVLLIRHHDRPK